MKQYSRASLFTWTSAFATCALLAACGGGNGGDAPPTAAIESTPVTQTTATVDQPSLAASEAATTVDPSPSPSTLSIADSVPPPAQSAIETPPPAADEAGYPPATTQDQPGAQALANKVAKLPLTRDALLAFNAEFPMNHEAFPAGVPGGYDWYLKGKKGAWNNVPSGFTTLTGWGQAFWAKGNSNPSAYLLIKNQLTLVCHGSQHQWSLLQSSGVQGSVFQPDYASNVATRATSPGLMEVGALAVSFPSASAYHFWPTAARGALPSGALCGVLTLVQARAEPLYAGSYTKPNLLLGMGADYWLNKTAPWDNYKTNRDVAIGRLKLVKTSWAWYGLSTASDADLDRLFNNGYIVSY